MSFTVRSSLVLAFLAAILIRVFAAESPQPPDAKYQEAFDKWKYELVDDLKENWLPLVGLFWLKPGENSFGSGVANAIVLPKGTAPARAGTFELKDGDVTAEFLPRVRATADGKRVTVVKLQPDISGTPTILAVGRLRMHIIQRGQRVGVRLKEVESPAVQSYTGPVFYPIDLNYRVTARFEAASDKQTVDVPNVLGDVTPTPAAGAVAFTLNGHELRLSDLGGDVKDGLFFVFSDLTSKTDTYPGGRFLKTGPVTNGTVVLDFNRAYSPPCAVTPYATCPLAPKENRLPIAISAGQRYDHKAHR